MWSAATDLGMVAILHIGNAPTRFDGGWGNVGWELPGGAGLGGFFRFANSLRHHTAEMMLAAMLYGGVRPPPEASPIITEEVGVAWLPALVARCDSLGLSRPVAVRDHAGRDGAAQCPASRRSWASATKCRRRPSSSDCPEMLVFSSDYPHGEGNADPIAIFEPGAVVAR